MNIGEIKNLPETYFRRVEFTTQNGCAVACTFCPQGPYIQATKGEERVLTKETVALVLKNLKGSPVREIHFSGFSEPFLHPECGDFILMAHQAGFKVGIFTTLKGLTKETLESIKDVPLVLFHVSMQIPGQNNRLGLTDETAWKQIDLLQSVRNNFYVRYGCVDVSYSKEQKEDMEKRCEEKGIEIIWGEMLDRAGNLPSGSHRSHDVGSHLICTRDVRSVIIPSGHICLCSMDFRTQHRMGNLKKKPYSEILCSEKVQRLLRSMRGSGETPNLLCHECESARSITPKEQFRYRLKGMLFPTTIKYSKKEQ